MSGISSVSSKTVLPAILVALLLSKAPASGQAEWLIEVDEAVLDEAMELRHLIHQNPELANREYDTAALVAAHLRGLGLDEVRTGVAHTGVIGFLRGGAPGPVVAVRVDMDALPVTEDTDFSFRSTETTTYLGQEVGVAHACGHDIHAAVQLGVASTLVAMRDELPGTVIFIFQPAEEGAPPGEEGGAELMVEEGVLRDPRPSAIFGLHSSPDLEVGRLAYRGGPFAAATDHFRIDLHGSQAHGAAPMERTSPSFRTRYRVSTTSSARPLPGRNPAVRTPPHSEGTTGPSRSVFGS